MNPSPAVVSPESSPRRLTLTLLLLVLLASLPPLLIDLGERDCTQTMEMLSLLSSQETWLRQQGWVDIPRDPNAWLMPTKMGEPRYVKPPMVVWLNMLAATGLRPETSTADAFMLRARYVA